MLTRLIYRLRETSFWYFVVLSVVFAELLTTLMSLILKGRVAQDYLITGFAVSLVVAPIVLTLVRRLYETSLTLAAAMDASLDGIAVLDKDERYIYLNDAHVRLYGYDSPGELMGKTWKTLYGEEELRRFEQEIMPELHRSGRWRGEALGRRQDGSAYHQEVSLSLIEGGRMVCVVRDITEQKKLEEKLLYNETYLRSIIESEPECVKIVSGDGVVLEMNPAGLAMVEADSAEQVIGRQSYALVNPEHRDAFQELIEKACRGEKGTLEFEITGLKGRRRWLETHAVPFYDDRDKKPVVLSVTRDVTERRQAAEKIARLNRLYSTLTGINEVIVRVRDREKLFTAACRIAVEHGLFKTAWIGLVDEDTRFVRPVARWGAGEGYLEDLRISVSDEVPEGRGPTGTAIRTGRHFISNDIANDEAMAPWREKCLKRGFRSSAAFPVRQGNQVIGAINLYSSEANFFNQEEVSLLGDLATDISFALEFMEQDELRRKAEEQIILAKQDWEETFNTITDMITIHDKDLNIIRANRAARDMLGLVEGVTAKCHQAYHGTTAPPPECPRRECHTRGNAITFETFEPHLDIFIELRSIPRFDSKGNFRGLIHIMRDITERKKTDGDFSRLLDDVTRAKNEWETTFDTVNELVMLVNKDFEIIRCNRSFSDFAGVPLTELPGHRFYEFFRPSDAGQLEQLKGVISSGNTMSRTEVRTTTGHWFYISHRPVFDDHGEFNYSVIIATDITALKSTEQRIIDSEEELKQRVEDLEKFYDMAVGREMRMKELKKEIKRLNGELLTIRNNGDDK